VSNGLKAALSVFLWSGAIFGAPQLFEPQSSAAGLITLAVLVGFAYAGFKLWPYKKESK
jgi:hypothetical protein